MSDYKMVLVMRKDLNMRKGKMAAQASHAAVSMVTELLSSKEGQKVVQKWMGEGQTKICVGIESEAALVDLAGRAEYAEVPHVIITDAGRTEFNGVPTVTCMAVGPGKIKEMDALTGDLKLL